MSEDASVTPVAAAADPAAAPVPPRQTARGAGRMNLTEGPIAKTLILFALPTLAFVLAAFCLVVPLASLVLAVRRSPVAANVE